MNLSFKRKDSTIAKTNPQSPVQSKKLSFKKWLKPIALILVIAVAGGAFYTYKFGSKSDKGGNGQITALAERGSVSSVIEGSGTIEALQQYEISSLAKGEVKADYFEEGDTVEKDAILYRMDDEAGYDAIDNAESNLSKAERTYNNAVDDINNLIVKSDTQGVVSTVYVQKGDSIGSNAKIADVIDNTTMILEIQFLESYAASMTAGVSSAELTLSKNGTVLYGTVTKISSGSVLSSVGARVTNVEISVANPGAIKEGDFATARVGNYACSSEGTFKNSGKGTIYSKVSGKVERVNIMAGDTVSYNQNVAILSNDNLSDISETRDNLNDARKKLNDANEALDDYVVKAPIAGKIIQKNIKAGEKLDNNASSVMAIIADLSSLVFDMSVDELDISKLEVGMEVDITADAIENVTFKGTVTNISIVGTSNNGVTSYPVKITLNPKDGQTGRAYESYDKLIPGMNVSASVIIEEVEDVIVVPVSAVRRGNIVIVSEDSTAQSAEMAFSMTKNKPQMPEGGMQPRSDGAFPEGMRGGMPEGFTSDGSMPVPPDFNKNEENSKSDSNNSKQNERMKAMIESLDIPDGYKAVVVETGLSDENYIEIKQGLNEGDKVLLPDTTSSNSQNTMMPGMGQMGGMPGGMPAGGMGGGMPSGMPAGGANRSGMGGMR